MKIDVRSAVVAAQNYLQSLLDIMGGKIEDLRLEEVEVSEDDKFWLVTLGFTRPADKAESPLKEILAAPGYRREYKIFKIDAETGNVESMRIREI